MRSRYLNAAMLSIASAALLLVALAPIAHGSPISRAAAPFTQDQIDAALLALPPPQLPNNNSTCGMRCETDRDCAVTSGCPVCLSPDGIPWRSFCQTKANKMPVQGGAPWPIHKPQPTSSTPWMNGTQAMNSTHAMNSTQPMYSRRSMNSTQAMNSTRHMHSKRWMNSTQPLNSTQAMNSTRHMHSKRWMNSTQPLNSTQAMNSTRHMHSKRWMNSTQPLNNTQAMNGTQATNNSTQLIFSKRLITNSTQPNQPPPPSSSPLPTPKFNTTHPVNPFPGHCRTHADCTDPRRPVCMKPPPPPGVLVSWTWSRCMAVADLLLLPPTTNCTQPTHKPMPSV
ncbi:hypothetical protein O9K51_05094 [Purpureocillium lavendulum]|uniref:Uncharacterized protein n=1 Tax=Purpureocillium lavendulum TaxID=1247861 RepID=A0AB34FRT1_9HYPO|nr:hypothetical protein O9K51_05094 [Purpureocillium lavendulum]